MDVLIERCAGLDVHRDTMVVTVGRLGPGGTRRSETRTFATMTSRLEQMVDWLAAEKVTLVGMESTGLCWKPVYYVPDGHFPVWTIIAEHLRNVPGRKTDVADSIWIAQLLVHDWRRRVSYHRAISAYSRELTRHGQRLTEERTRTIQRLKKVLQDAAPRAVRGRTDPTAPRP
jgi:hypothetical protein